MAPDSPRQGAPTLVRLAGASHNPPNCLVHFRGQTVHLGDPLALGEGPMVPPVPRAQVWGSPHLKEGKSMMMSHLCNFSTLQGGAWGVKWEKLGVGKKKVGEVWGVGGPMPHLAEPPCQGGDKCDEFHTFATEPT